MEQFKTCEQVASNPEKSGDLASLWSQICNELGHVVSTRAVEHWFGPLQLDRVESDRLVISSDNDIYRFWIEENYLSQLISVAGRVLGRSIKIEFTSVTKEVATPAPISSSAPAPMKTRKAVEQHLAPVESHGLNPRYTFESFVVGVNNQMAHAAAFAVAQHPATSYNPLFFHGSVGLGKTHLMQAIGQHLQKNRKGYRVSYVTSEQFTNDYIHAIQLNELSKFRKRYRNVDALLIDDVQFFSGKERSQEEFFHTFNALFDGSKQLILTSDVPPSQLNGLEKRLVSRFEYGLTAELSVPDMETRMAILKHKLSAMRVELSDEVLSFIADRVRSNIRRLEGALTRVAAYGSLQGKKLTTLQAESVLRDLLQIEVPTNISIDSIQKRVAETFDVRIADMTSKRRPNNIAIPRMIAMHLSRSLTRCSLNEIGSAFGGRDHGTVMHADKTIKQRLTEDATLRHQVECLVQQLTSGR